MTKISVRRFGRVVAQESQPGLNIGLPWGMDQVDLLKPSETKTVQVVSRIDTEDELDYFRNGGILSFVLRNLARAA